TDVAGGDARRAAGAGSGAAVAVAGAGAGATLGDADATALAEGSGGAGLAGICVAALGGGACVLPPQTATPKPAVKIPAAPSVVATIARRERGLGTTVSFGVSIDRFDTCDATNGISSG